jgi:transcription elongation factor GreA
MAQQEEPPVLTSAAYGRLKAELEELASEGRRSMSERLLRARELGDVTDNAEYEQTKNDQAMLEGRIRRLEWIVKHAVVQETPVSADTVIPGMVVRLRPLDAPEDEEVYLLAASKEERSKGARTITASAPLGAALLGKTIGQKVSYDAPGGTFSYEVVSFTPWDGT